MKITLYKNCILTNSYREVFDCKIRDFGKDETGETKYNSFFNLYLSSLENFVYIDNDTIYTNFKGSLYFDLSINNENLYTYNYMKIENNDFVRYCFIDDIEIRNDIAVVKYSEDIWHTYSKDIKLKKSLLHSTLYDLKESTIVEKFLPKEYTEKDIELLPITEIGANALCTLLFKIQLFKLSTEGSITNRILFNTMIRDSENNIDYQYGINIIQNLIKKATNNIVSYKNEDWFYDIDDIMILPTAIFPKFDIPVTLFSIDDYEFINFVPAVIFASGTIQKQLFEYNIVKEYEYNTDLRKIISIGTLNSKVDILQNGKPIKIKVLISADDTNTSILFLIQGKVLDVTSDFIYTPSIASVSSSENQLSKLNRNIKKVNAIGSGINAIGSIGAAFATGSYGMGLAGIQAGFQTITNLKDIKSKTYDSTRLIQVKDVSPQNYIYGITVFKMVTLNDDEVLQALNEQGYIVENDTTLSIDPIDIEEVTEDTNIINPIRFNRISIYGEFTQNIAKQIEEILMNGTKIIYNRSGNGII